MKSISSSIVVLAGIYGLNTSVPLLLVHHSILPVLGVVAGLVAISLGLVGWWASLKYDR